MSTFILRLNRTLSHQNLTQRMGISSSFSARQVIPMPANVQEIAAGEHVCFSSARYRDLSSYGTVSQMSSVFSTSFMSGQLSYPASEANDQAQGFNVTPPSAEQLAVIQNYENLASISLDSVTQTNVPEPFSSPVDLESQLNMNNCIGQQMKYLAGELQEVMHQAD